LVALRILFKFDEVYSQPDGLALGEEADFEALNCLSALNLIRSRKLQFSTEAQLFCKTLVPVAQLQTYNKIINKTN